MKNPKWILIKATSTWESEQLLIRQDFKLNMMKVYQKFMDFGRMKFLNQKVSITIIYL